MCFPDLDTVIDQAVAFDSKAWQAALGHHQVVYVFLGRLSRVSHGCRDVILRPLGRGRNMRRTLPAWTSAFKSAAPRDRSGITTMRRRLPVMEKKHANRGPFLESTSKHSIYILSAVTRGSPESDPNLSHLHRLLYLGGDSHYTGEACLEDSVGCALPGEETRWGQGGLSCPSRLYLEFYRHPINRIALCIIYTDDNFGCFALKDGRRCDEGKEIPRWYGRADTWWGTGCTTHQQDDGENQ